MKIRHLLIFACFLIGNLLPAQTSLPALVVDLPFCNASLLGQAGALCGVINANTPSPTSNWLNSPNSAMYFDGTTHLWYDQADPISADGSMTLSFWMKPDDPDLQIPMTTINNSPYNQYLISTGAQTSSIGYVVIWNRGKLVVSRRTSGHIVGIGPVGAVGKNTFSHIVMVYDASTLELKLYINNALIQTATASPLVTYGNHKSFVVGSPNTPGSTAANFHGTMYGIKVFDQALNATQVAALHNPSNCGSNKNAAMPQEIQNQAFKLFPNPADSYAEVHLDPTLLSENHQIEVLNSLGQQVFFHPLEKQTDLKISLENYNSGLYFVRLLHEGIVVQSQKLIKH